jgi:hypothetical protein
LNISRKTAPISVGRTLAQILLMCIQGMKPVLLMGDTGVGKSQFAVQAARKAGMQARVLTLSLYDSAAELMGLPHINKRGVTVYARPSILPVSGRGVLILEELNRASPLVLAGIYELLLTGRIGEYTLPPGWVIMACANPPDDRYEVNILDDALLARFIHIEVCVDRLEWIDWAENNDIHGAVLDLARDDAELFAMVPPRTWETVSDMLLVGEQLEESRENLLVLMAQITESDVAAYGIMRYAGSLPDQSAVTPEDVLARYAWDPDLADQVRKILADGHTDMLTKLLNGMEQLLKSKQLADLITNYRFSLDNFETFLDDVDGDRGAVLRKAFGRNPASVSCLDVAASDALRDYQSSDLKTKVEFWKQTGKTHRMEALVVALCKLLAFREAKGTLNELREDPHVLRSLHRMVDHYGKPHADGLRIMLASFGIHCREPKEL